MLRKLATIYCLAVLVSCNDQKIPDIMLSSVKISEQKTYHPGEPVSVAITITTNNFNYVGVPVHFSMIQLAKVDQLRTHPDAEAFSVGDLVLDSLQDGSNQVTANLILPHDISEAGEYVMVAYIDPGDAVLPKDVNLTYRYSSGYHLGRTEQYGQFTMSAEGYHDFAFTDASINQDFLILPVPASGDDASQTIPGKKEPDIIGHFHATQFGQKLANPYMKAEIKLGETWTGVHFWEPSSPDRDHLGYQELHKLNFSYNSDNHYFSFDLGLNPSIIQSLYTAYDANAEENTFELRFTIVDQSEHLEFKGENNTFTLKVPYRFYEIESDTFTAEIPAEGSASLQNQKLNAIHKSFVKSYKKVYGDKSKIALDIDFASNNSLSSSNYTAVFDNSAAMAFYVFKHRAEIFTTKAKAYAYGKTAYSGYEALVSVLGNKVINNSNNSYDALSKSYDKNWSEDVDIFSSTFTIGIVPVSVSVGLNGSMGYGASFTFAGPSLEAKGTFFQASLGAEATASINLLVASGGVTAEFIIISDELSLTGTANISSSNIVLGLTLANELKAIEGDFYIWVKYPVYHWCCSIHKKTKTHTIYRTDALFNKHWNILRTSYTLNF